MLPEIELLVTLLLAVKLPEADVEVLAVEEVEALLAPPATLPVTLAVLLVVL